MERNWNQRSGRTSGEVTENRGLTIEYRDNPERRVTKKSSSFWAGELQGGQYGGKAEDRDCKADTGRGREGRTIQDGADPG